MSDDLNYRFWTCHICGFNDGVDGRLETAGLGKVASDCTPCDATGRLGICTHCGAIQKDTTDRDWRSAVAKIYGGYDLYALVEDNTDQVIFDVAGETEPRSKRLARLIDEQLSLPAVGRLLDVGCGSGAMLRGFSAVHSEWALYGFEPSLEKYGDRLSSLPGVAGLFEGDIGCVVGTYDLISMVHVLEHIVDPCNTLSRLRELFVPSSHLFIQVPDVRSNPFDLGVVDHCTHFTIESLERTLNAADFEVTWISDSVVAKEIACLARPRDSSEQPPLTFAPAQSRVDPDGVFSDAVNCLERIRDEAVNFASNGATGVFGTAIAANWVYSALSGGVEFFVDEDISRVGKTLHGKPIYAPSDLRSGSRVFLALPAAVGQSVLNRIARDDITFCLPQPI